eukprot:c38955_g1_i1 orf=473-1705(-)
MATSACRTLVSGSGEKSVALSCRVEATYRRSSSSVHVLGRSQTRHNVVQMRPSKGWKYELCTKLSFASLHLSTDMRVVSAVPLRLSPCHSRFRMNVPRALAMELTEETFVPNGGTMKSLDASSLQSSTSTHKRLREKNRADDSSLHNPLLRLERMGCGWLGVILEWDGVIVEDDADIEKKAWAALAEEEGKRPPPTFILKRAEGMKNEQAIAEVLCWSRNSKEINRLARRKEGLYQEMQGGIYRVRPTSREFVFTLKNYKIPIAVVSTRPRKFLERAIEAIGMEGLFNVVVAAEDVYRGKPDPEMFMYAAQLLGFIPERCIVIGNSNRTVEAAHDAFMKCIAVTGLHRMFELGAADLVVGRLNDLSLIELKNLADLESPEFVPPDPDAMIEPEVELVCPTNQTCVAVRDP